MELTRKAFKQANEINFQSLNTARPWGEVEQIDSLKQITINYLALQEEKYSGLNEVGVGALSASSFGGTFLFWFPLAEQSGKNIWLHLAFSFFKHKTPNMLNWPSKTIF